MRSSEAHPLLINGKSEHTEIQDTYISEQYQITSLSTAYDEGAKKSSDKR